jgi:co-chaperonin GroES (HSP10)
MIEIVDKRIISPEFEPFQPLNDRVLIKRVVLQSAPEGFVVPERYRQHTNVGIVKSVGNLVVGVSPGDRVRFGEYNAEKFELDGEEFELVRLADIRGVERVKTNNS